MPEVSDRNEFVTTSVKKEAVRESIPNHQRLGNFFRTLSARTVDNNPKDLLVHGERTRIDNLLTTNFDVSWKNEWVRDFFRLEDTAGLPSDQIEHLKGAAEADSLEAFQKALSSIKNSVLQKLLQPHWEKVAQYETTFEAKKGEIVDEFFRALKASRANLFPHMSEEEFENQMQQNRFYASRIEFADPLTIAGYEAGAYYDPATTQTEQVFGVPHLKEASITVASSPDFQRHALFHELVHAVVSGRNYVKQAGGEIVSTRNALGKYTWLNESLTEFITDCLMEGRPINGESLKYYAQHGTVDGVYQELFDFTNHELIEKGVGIESLLHAYTSDLKTAEERDRYGKTVQEVKNRTGKSLDVLTKEFRPTLPWSITSHSF